MNANGTLKLILNEAIVVAVGVALISGAYLWVLPKFFNDHKTYSVLIAGLLLIAVVSGIVAHKVVGNGRMSGWLMVVSVSLLASLLGLVLSLFVILNTRGA